MAKLECSLKGDIYQILDEIETKILKGSISATRESESIFKFDSGVCIVRVYERYSLSGGNRVSLSLTFLQVGDTIRLSAITAGGSQAMFYKMNTFGECAFLEIIRNVVTKYRA